MMRLSGYECEQVCDTPLIPLKRGSVGGGLCVEEAVVMSKEKSLEHTLNPIPHLLPLRGAREVFTPALTRTVASSFQP